jgi:HlyD family secretion protein
MTRTRAALAFIALLLAACGGDEVQLAGTVERTTLELAAPSAELVTGVPVEAGDRVLAGQVVVQLDTAVADAELRAAEASREAAEAGLTESEGEYARTAQLRRSGVSTQQSLDSSRRRRDEARAMAAERDARIAQAQKRRDDLTIRSPVDGVVDQVAFELGERVPAGGVVAVVLADETPWVRVWMPASEVAGAGPGTRAEVKVEGTDDWLPAPSANVAGSMMKGVGKVLTTAAKCPEGKGRVCALPRKMRSGARSSRNVWRVMRAICRLKSSPVTS